MTKNEMLQALSQIWLNCVQNHPDADHDKILEHLHALQVLIFEIGG